LRLRTSCMQNKWLWCVLILAGIGGAIVVGREPSLPKQALGNSQKKATVRLPVEGMGGAGAVATVTKGLLSLPGVSAVDVNLKSERVTVTYDRDTIVIQALVETLQTLGYKSRVPTENQLQVLDFQVKFN
jgi:copper chaperone CopZ